LNHKGKGGFTEEYAIMPAKDLARQQFLSEKMTNAIKSM
jgi:hypothetical protein